MTDLGRALDFALHTATAAGRTAMSHYGRDIDRKQKPDGTWATEADWAVEAQVRLRIARSFPEHNILGEEEGLSMAGGAPAREGAPTWIIDPIDGTNNFIAGIPIWAILVALRVEDRNVLGVCHAPALGETYHGAAGAGAFCNGARLHVSSEDDIERATILHSGLDHFRSAGLDSALMTLVAGSFRSRGFGDFWGHMLVARGAAHAMVEPQLSIWDVAALEPIVVEAGGRLTDLEGAPWENASPCITTNGLLHAEVLRLMKETTEVDQG